LARAIERCRGSAVTPCCWCGFALTYASRDLLHSVHIPRTGNRKSGFDHIHAQPGVLHHALRERDADLARLGVDVIEPDSRFQSGGYEPVQKTGKRRSGEAHQQAGRDSGPAGIAAMARANRTT